MKRIRIATGAAIVGLLAGGVSAQQGEQEASPAPQTTSVPVVQGEEEAPSTRAAPSINLPANLPSLAELEAMSDDEFEELFGLKPKADIPAAARRSLRAVGVLSEGDGGMAAGTLGEQPAALVEAALQGNRGRLVSRWGHIVLRRALASRMAAPSGMNAVDLAAMRTSLLVRMGEGRVARALAQQVDNAAYNTAMSAAAFDAFVATGDLAGACPMLEIVRPFEAEDPRIKVTRDICDAYSGDSAGALRRLDRAARQGVLSRTEMLLAQRYAGSGGATRRAVAIDWDEASEITPFSYSLATTLGLEVPDNLRAGAGRYYAMVDATSPVASPEQRLSSAWFAASSGVLSAQAMVDLLSLVYAQGREGEGAPQYAEQLRRAYVAADVGERMAAIRAIWDIEQDTPYGGTVTTAYAAARMPVSGALAGDAGELIAAMLSAGLDRNALRWFNAVDEGSLGWAQLVLIEPQGRNITADAIEDFEGSDRQRQFLVAGLAALGRTNGASTDGLDLARETRWTRAMSAAARSGSAPLVAMLAGVGMQGDSWDRMTPLHLFHIVRSLARVGLAAEARLIAAEAVVRG